MAKLWHIYAKRNYKENKGIQDYTQKQTGVLKTHVKQKQSNIKLHISVHIEFYER